jgi:UDP-N-acetylmuramoyl-tripeptide--D-alanyl-D-alanine ligase
LLRTIFLGGVPLFTAWQFLRLRRALHVFQLEGYKRDRFAAWSRAHRRRVLFGSARPSKKPLVMTGRAWRILIVATALSALAVLGATAAAHLLGGWPLDVITWALSTLVVFAAPPQLISASDRCLAPVQRSINRRYTHAARTKLERMDPVVVGVTGSFGKTSTKFAVSGLLEPAGPALATPESYNTPMGVVRAVNERLRAEHRWFVVEMGAYGPGEIAELCELVHPQVGILTAVGPAHLERFGSLDVIRATKYELIESLPPDGLAVMNCDDAEVRSLAGATSHVEVVRYALERKWSPHITAEAVRVSPRGSHFTIVDVRSGERAEVTTRLLGSHSIGHVLAGVAVAAHFGASPADVADSVERLRPVEHRLQLIEGTGGVVVIDDAFNSNPEGARVAIEVLGAMPARRRVIVTPGIIELGNMQFEANRRFGSQAAAVADVLIVVADLNREAICAGAVDAGSASPVEVVTVPTLAEAQRRLERLLGPEDAVLFENDLPDHQEAGVYRRH